jgi:hypothetical protein
MRPVHSRIMLWVTLGVLLGVAAMGIAPGKHAPEAVYNSQGEPAPYTPQQAQAKLHALMAGGAQVRLTRHARERMESRGISLEEVKQALAAGEVPKPAHVGSRGDWLYKVEYQPQPQARALEVVVKIEEAQLLVITTMRDGED